MTRTEAPGMGAPCESRTKPLICPVSNWACAGTAIAMSATATRHATHRILDGTDVDISPPWPCGLAIAGEWVERSMPAANEPLSQEISNSEITPSRPKGKTFRRRPDDGRRALGRAAEDLDVAEGDLVAVVLKQDVAGNLGAESGHVLELALRDGGPELRRAQLVLQDLAPVEPVLDVVAAYEDPRLVPFAHRPQRLVRGRRQDVVEGAGLAMGAHLGVRMTRVVEHLVLVRDRPFAVLGDEILEAAVAARGDAPVEAQVEVGEALCGHDVSAPVRVAGPGRDVRERAVLHHPAVLGEVRLLEAAPARRRLAVEEEAPARLLLRGRELVGRRRIRGRGQGGRGQADQADHVVLPCA